jgi:hypothetical protein
MPPEGIQEFKNSIIESAPAGQKKESGNAIAAQL